MQSDGDHLIVEDFGGTSIAVDATQLEEILSSQFGRGVNEFWLSHTPGGYPSMSIMTFLEHAALYFFPQHGHPGFASQGAAMPDQSGFTTFATSSVDETIGIPNSIVVDLCAAKTAAGQFLAGSKLPDCITWIEL